LIIRPGDLLVDLCRAAENELVLAAPFIKVRTLEKLLAVVSSEVQVKCVTRWRLDEIASGVSDLDVWLVVRDRPNTSMWLRSDLHAKFYRSDSACLIGSANLTHAALGWSSRPNLELLINSPIQVPLREFEDDLFAGSSRVDESIYKQMCSALEHFVVHRVLDLPIEGQLEAERLLGEIGLSVVSWIPSLRHPEKLYIAYLGKLDELTTASRAAALNDLSVLDIPLGLSREGFESYVGVQLLQMPIIRRVDNFLVEPQRFGAVTALLNQLPCRDNVEFSANTAWQTLMRWLLFFMPTRYQHSVPNHSELFKRLS
jgi:hypothetical protein